VTRCPSIVCLWVPRWIFAAGTWGVATVLFLRALAGLAAIGSDASNATWDLALYSPQCLVLALLCAVVAARSTKRTSRSRRGRLSHTTARSQSTRVGCGIERALTRAHRLIEWSGTRRRRAG